MTEIPKTTKEQYITGMTALNIPTEDGDFAEWHFHDTFLSGRGRVFVTGVNFPTSNRIWGDYGIRECGDILRYNNVEVKGKVYSANYIRALLDIFYRHLSKGDEPSHIELNEYLSDFEIQEFKSNMKLYYKTNSIKNLSQSGGTDTFLKQIPRR